MVSSSSSQVKIISKCFVKPKTISEKSKEPYHFSPLDHVVLPAEYIQKGLLFLKPSTVTESDDSINPKDFMETWLQKLKDSLAATLVHFYPLAGRLSTSKTDDASSEIFNSQEEEEDTIDNNNLFSLKNPPIFRQVSTDPIYSLPFSERDELISQFESPVLKERMFHFSSETVRSLKSKVNQDCGTTKISSLQSLTAFMWRSITSARKLPNDQETTCRLVSDNRSKMDPPLPMTYFGVCVSPVKTTVTSGNLLENEFGWAALKLHQAVTEHTSSPSKELDSSMHRWLKFLSTSRFDIYSDLNIVHIGSSPRFNKYGCEFEMGKAVAVRSGYNGKYDGKVTAYPGREGGGSIDLEVCLLPEFMEALESDQEFMSLVSFSSS